MHTPHNANLACWLSLFIGLSHTAYSSSFQPTQNLSDYFYSDSSSFSSSTSSSTSGTSDPEEEILYDQLLEIVNSPLSQREIEKKMTESSQNTSTTITEKNQQVIKTLK